MASAPEIDLAVAAEATRSVSLHQGLQGIIANREADIVDAMVLTYRGNKANYEYLLSKIAAISELRAIEADMDRQARLAIEKASGDR